MRRGHRPRHPARPPTARSRGCTPPPARRRSPPTMPAAASRSRYETGNEWEQANAHLLLAHVLLDDGQADAAGRELEAARRAYGDRMSGMDEGFVAVEEARRALQQGDAEGAADRAREAIELLGNLSVPGQLGDAHLAARPELRRAGRARPRREGLHVGDRRPAQAERLALRARARLPVVRQVPAPGRAAPRRPWRRSSTRPTWPRPTTTARIVALIGLLARGRDGGGRSGSAAGFSIATPTGIGAVPPRLEPDPLEQELGRPRGRSRPAASRAGRPRCRTARPPPAARRSPPADAP